MKNVLTAPFMKEICDVTANMYRQGWDERNGGNISVLLDEEELGKYINLKKPLKHLKLGFEADPIVRGKYFLVTGTGKYFDDIAKDPETNLGIVKIGDCGKCCQLFWGWKDGGTFTSEFPAHLMSHAARLKVDPSNRIVMHTHPTYTICMGACCPTDEKELTKRLWKSNTEAIVVFPEGVGVLPCMLCGTNEIGEATAEKMKDFRLVSWTNHGIYGVGHNIEETFGLIETVEKTAQIYMLTLGHVQNVIPDDVLVGLKNLWHLKPLKGVIAALDEE